MNVKNKRLALAIALVMGTGQALAATQQEEDSVYQYGRWAVLSPAAGGAEPYVAAAMPDAANNLRPEEAFSPEIIGLETPEPPPVIDDPRDRPPPPPPPSLVIDDPRDRPRPPPPPSL